MKIKILLACFLVQTFSLFSQERSNVYNERMEYFRQNPLEQNQIIFLGNSLTQGGRWQEFFPNQRVANRGISGDNTSGILARLDEIINAQPEKLFILTGVNDISQDLSNDYIIENMRQIVRNVQAGSPETIIFWQTLLPINNNFGRFNRLIDKEPQIEELNALIEKMAKEENIHFINLFPLFQNEEGLLDPKFTTNGLHINGAGYEIWVNKIRQFVE